MSNEEESVSVSSGRLHFLEDVPQSIQVEVARSQIPLKTVMTWKKDTIVEFKKIAEGLAGTRGAHPPPGLNPPDAVMPRVRSDRPVGPPAAEAAANAQGHGEMP